VDANQGTFPLRGVYIFNRVPSLTLKLQASLRRELRPRTRSLVTRKIRWTRSYEAPIRQKQS